MNADCTYTEDRVTGTWVCASAAHPENQMHYMTNTSKAIQTSTL